MTVESVTHISDLNTSYPAGTDPKSEGDDHIRNIKTALTTDFPGITGAVTSTHTELNLLDGVTATTAELNILDGVTSTAAELNILDGVTSTAAELNILDGVTATASEINLVDGSTTANAVASKAVILDSDKGITLSGAAPATPTANTLYKDSIVKCWALISNPTGTPSVADGFNVSSLTDVGTGSIKITFDVAMASTSYATIVTPNTAGVSLIPQVVAQTTADVHVVTKNVSGTALDTSFSIIVIGDQ